MAMSTSDYDRLERAIIDGARLAIVRRKNELVVIPKRLRVRNGRELIDAVHPTTGEPVSIGVDEIEHFDVIR